jgi:osmotically-inducible protein OsmY
MTKNTETTTDHELQTSVSDELEWTPEVDAAHIGVAADGGVVTLSGEVDSYRHRIAARDAVLRVKGVTAVADDLVIKNSYRFAGTDTELAESVAKVLSVTAGIPEGSVKAEVRDHIVTLTGTVEWNYQRDFATRAVERIVGVLWVDNTVELKPRATAVGTENLIKKAFIRDATLDADAISVSIHGDEATLTGTVHSWAEKGRAGRAAWSAPAIGRIKNELVVKSYS